MKQEKFIYTIVSFFLMIAFILPFVYITKYTYLTADDFCRTSIEFNIYFSNFVYWYENITGRYTNYFLSYLPLYSKHLYRVSLISLFLSLGASIYFFIRSIFKFLRCELHASKILFLSTLFFITLISQLPSLYEYFYWYASSTVYLISTIFLLLFLSLLLRLESTSYYYLPTLCLLIVLMNGNNEMLILLSNFILVSLLVWKKYKLNIFSNRLLIANIFAIISGIVVILSPASEGRQTHFLNSGDFLYSINYSLLSAGMFCLKSLLEFPYVVFYLGMFLFVNQVFKNRNLSHIYGIHPIFLIIWTFIAFSLVIFVPYYATGGLNVNLGRIGNLVHVVFLIFIMINLTNAALFFQKKPFNYRFKRNYILLIFVLYLGSLGVINSNYKNIFLDFSGHNFMKYQFHVKKRETTLKNFEGDHLVLQKIKGTRTLPHWEISSDAEHWSNECYLNYLISEYQLEVETITIKEKFN